VSEAFIEGVLTTVIGMIIVLAILGLLYVLVFLIKNQNKEETKLPDNVNLESLENKTADMELVAVITAAIAATLETTTDKLVVKSITKVQGWNYVARREQQRNIV
jgi:sodium pump decarboxylase gamma subunit